MIILRNILLFILLLTVIVSLHELGHLIAAKIFNVYCQEYAIGMGPKLFSFKGKETEYSIRAFPIGGFVAMAGDDENSLETTVDTTNIPFERTLKGIAKWKRVIIMLAGIFMNFILAITIYSLIILNNGSYVVSSKPEISYIQENSPAEASGLKAGDIVTDIGFSGIEIQPSDYIELISFTSAYDGKGPWTIKVDRDGEKLTFEVTPEYIENEDRYMIGIGFSNVAVDAVDVNIFNCWYYGFRQAMFIIKVTWSSFISLFKTRAMENLSGPIGIYNTVSEVSSQGFYYYVQLVAAISINVGIVNALPLPIFDGGRVLLLLIEMIIGRPLSKKAENLVMSISVALLFALMIYVTFNDVLKVMGG